MKTLTYYLSLTFFLLLLCSISCKNDISKPIPEKHPDQSQGKYDMYIGRLEEAYNTNDYFDAAVQLANLKASPKETFDLLHAGITENPNNCSTIYEWYYMYDRHNFGLNIYKLDTTKFIKAVRLCDDLLEGNSYQKYAMTKDEEVKHAESIQAIEDSTHFNIELATELKRIYKLDQGIRNRMSVKNINPDLKIKLGLEMNRIDSLNLIEIDRIFKEFGYPSRSLVGQQGNFTPALVIHHSRTLETRYKYLPLLVEAVKKGKLPEETLGMIKRRINYMELDLQ